MTAEAAGAILARDYESLKTDILRTVRGKLASQRVALDEADLDAAYNQGWHALYSKLAAGDAIENRNGLLVSIVHRRAIDEYRAQHPDRRADEETLADDAVEPDFAAALDDQIRLRRFLEGMRERLDERERAAATLCYLHDHTRPEAAALLGIKPRRMEKIMDDVSKKVRVLVGEIEAGAWCETRRSLVKAYALGLLDPSGERYRLAVDHLQDCSFCRRRVLLVRGIASVAPPVPATLGVAGGPRGHGKSTATKSAAIAAACGCALAAGAIAVDRFQNEPARDAASASPRAASTAAPTPRPTSTAAATPPAATPTATAKHDPRPTATPDHRRPERAPRGPSSTRTPAPTATPSPAAPRPTATLPPPPPSPAPTERATPAISYDGAEEFDLR